ncbi:MAG TPA: hypothetical protein VFE70_04090 [Candidatus Elarobacter sp.]|nr:hypothetical protein [Candidatus Elarobacter sp.]
MRGVRLFPLVLLATAVALCGCIARHAENGPVATTASAPARAPQDPDLAAVMERFYQMVEGEHWQFADLMLTPGYHTRLGLDGMRPRYANLTGIDVTLQQTGSSTVVAHMSARDRSNPARVLNFIETSRLFWDGQQWGIDEIARQDLSGGSSL